MRRPPTTVTLFGRPAPNSNWTRAFAVVNYEQAVESFRQTDRLTDSERAMLMGGACARAYGSSPKVRREELVAHEPQQVGRIENPNTSGD